MHYGNVWICTGSISCTYVLFDQPCVSTCTQKKRGVMFMVKPLVLYNAVFKLCNERRLLVVVLMDMCYLRILIVTWEQVENQAMWVTVYPNPLQPRLVLSPDSTRPTRSSVHTYMYLCWVIECWACDSAAEGLASHPYIRRLNHSSHAVRGHLADVCSHSNLHSYCYL